MNKPDMKGNRAFGDIGSDSPDSIRQSGGEDPRRAQVRIVMETKVRDHDQSGYNHNGVKTPEAAEGDNAQKEMMARRAMSMGTPHPDGTYSE